MPCSPSLIQGSRHLLCRSKRSFESESHLQPKNRSARSWFGKKSLAWHLDPTAMRWGPQWLCQSLRFRGQSPHLVQDRRHWPGGKSSNSSHRHQKEPLPLQRCFKEEQKGIMIMSTMRFLHKMHSIHSLYCLSFGTNKKENQIELTWVSWKETSPFSTTLRTSPVAWRLRNMGCSMFCSSNSRCPLVWPLGLLHWFDHTNCPCQATDPPRGRQPTSTNETWHWTEMTSCCWIEVWSSHLMRLPRSDEERDQVPTLGSLQGIATNFASSNHLACRWQWWCVRVGRCQDTLRFPGTSDRSRTVFASTVHGERSSQILWWHLSKNQCSLGRLQLWEEWEQQWPGTDNPLCCLTWTWFYWTVVVACSERIYTTGKRRPTLSLHNMQLHCKRSTNVAIAQHEDLFLGSLVLPTAQLHNTS